MSLNPTPVQLLSYQLLYRGVIIRPPIKNLFRDLFDPFFGIGGGGDQDTKGFFLKMGFETKKYHFYTLLAWIVTEAILYQKFEKK